MARPDRAKPATARHGEPVSKVEQLGGQLSNPALIDIQARRLTRRFAISLPIALVVASLHYREVTR
jgi:hypothetical protein